MAPSPTRWVTSRRDSAGPRSGSARSGRSTRAMSPIRPRGGRSATATALSSGWNPSWYGSRARSSRGSRTRMVVASMPRGDRGRPDRARAPDGACGSAPVSPAPWSGSGRRRIRCTGGTDPPPRTRPRARPAPRPAAPDVVGPDPGACPRGRHRRRPRRLDGGPPRRLHPRVRRRPGAVVGRRDDGGARTRADPGRRRPHAGRAHRRRRAGRGVPGGPAARAARGRDPRLHLRAAGRARRGSAVRR